ncbi:glycosyltransferase family 2 protein [Bradyrhizobium forestalis]|uniref:Glycosyltransferase family 2 protein n=1 Tax=Bradyrhizobium forestalis TaxID=1419263 RepID=A0A2M8RCT5_9BRAD|nr:glycosyltransferase family 2 protein [Bradyrhizobium forestalis]PJG55628.1 glycosyltransferase family 2 protein [Bradyrhizobium forestalis]
MLSVIILTYNEEKHLDRALESVAGIASEVFVVDSFSTDSTVEIAKRHNAIVLQNPFVNQAKQFQWALDNAPIRSDWVMRLDADEYIEADLVAEIRARIPTLPSEVTGVNLKRKLVFMERTIKYGGRGILVMTRIWRRGYGKIEDRWMDEHIFVRDGRTVTFQGGFADHNLSGLSSFTDKHNRYATREAVEVLNQRLHFMRPTAALSRSGSSSQASIKRFLKESFYNRIPFQISSLAYFLYRYLFLLGFLDGREGLIYNVLQGFWYRFLVGSKVEELERAVRHLREPDAVAAELARLTGLKIEPTVAQS